MITLQLILDSPISLEAACVVPDQWPSLRLDQIAALPVLHGNRTLQLSEAFDLAGDASDAAIEIHGDCSRVKWLGHGMKAGRLSIQGSVGMHTGAAMQGGDIVVHGDAGDWLGAEMRGGTIRVQGNAGDRVGAAYQGSTRGMRGGTILIAGDAGHEVGAYQRRGLIAVGGHCGDFSGVGMIAGSIFAFGGTGGKTGAGMKRGTIAVAGPLSLPPTFHEACDFQPPFWTLYLRHLRQLGFALPPGLEGRTLRRFSGDSLALGQGEVLVAL